MSKHRYIYIKPDARPRVYNLYGTSATLPRKGFDGLEGRPFIGEVISEYLTGTESEMLSRLGWLRRQHGKDIEAKVMS